MHKIAWEVDGDGYHIGTVRGVTVAMVSVNMLRKDEWFRKAMLRLEMNNPQIMPSGSHTTAEEARVEAEVYYEYVMKIVEGLL